MDSCGLRQSWLLMRNTVCRDAAQVLYSVSASARFTFASVLPGLITAAVQVQQCFKFICFRGIMRGRIKDRRP